MDRSAIGGPETCSGILRKRGPSCYNQLLRRKPTRSRRQFCNSKNTPWNRNACGTSPRRFLPASNECCTTWRRLSTMHTAVSPGCAGAPCCTPSRNTSRNTFCTHVGIEYDFELSCRSRCTSDHDTSMFCKPALCLLTPSQHTWCTDETQRCNFSLSIYEPHQRLLLGLHSGDTSPPGD